MMSILKSLSQDESKPVFQCLESGNTGSCGPQKNTTLFFIGFNCFSSFTCEKGSSHFFTFKPGGNDSSGNLTRQPACVEPPGENVEYTGFFNIYTINSINK